ncbi:MAG: SurA N-terminal domain-containing protein, partial [Burkholderiaceae bacterium]
SELAETFSNTVYEQADSLKAAADKLGLKIQSANGVGRQPNPDAAPNAPYNSPKFLNALFSDDVIKNKHNTEAIEVTPNVLVAGRVVNYRPATKKPFEDVKESIRKDVVAAEAAELAKKAGEAKLAELRKHDDPAGFGPEKDVSRAASDALPPEAADAVLAADVSALPAYTGTALPDEGYGIYRIGKVSLPEKPDQARREAEAKQITSTLAQEETVAYIHALRDKIGVKIVKPVVAASDGASEK